MDRLSTCILFFVPTCAYAIIDISPGVVEAFKCFTSDLSLLALPLSLKGTSIQFSTAIKETISDRSLQNSLSLLDEILNPTSSLYLLLRRSNSIFAVTFVPYRAPQDERKSYLRYRKDLVKLLGESHFESSLVCKEVGEVTDARSWVEREQHHRQNATSHISDVCDGSNGDPGPIFMDLGHRKNKCRLCDRRMKNKITDGALTALQELDNEGDLLQIV